jgi:hypothetical protein
MYIYGSENLFEGKRLCQPGESHMGQLDSGVKQADEN